MRQLLRHQIDVSDLGVRSLRPPARDDFPASSSRLAEASPWMLESMCSSFMTLSTCLGAWEEINLWDDD